MSYSTTTIDKFRVGYDFQKEWVEKRGLLIVMAFYLGEVGAGLFLGSILLGWRLGLLVGVTLVAVGDGGCHLLYLGHPLRFWRIFLRPFSASWISRGMYFIALFIAVGLVSYFVGGTALTGIAAFFAVCVLLYVGFAMGFSASIPFWNNSLLPIMFFATGLASGASLLLVIYSLSPQIVLIREMLDLLGLLLGVILLILIATYMLVNYYSSIAAKASVVFLGAGRFVPAFYGGVVLLGLALPLPILALAYLGSVPFWLLTVAGISALLGSFAWRYSILKAGIFAPIT